MEGMEGRARNANRLLLVPITSIGVPFTFIRTPHRNGSKERLLRPSRGGVGHWDRGSAPLSPPT
jgi:hypothetical protein